jgi:hypothetical protein
MVVRHIKRDQGVYGPIILKCFGGNRFEIFIYILLYEYTVSWRPLW